MQIDRLEEHTLRAELTQAIKSVLDKAATRGALPELGPGTAAYIADCGLALLMALDDAQDQLRRDGMLNEE